MKTTGLIVFTILLLFLSKPAKAQVESVKSVSIQPLTAHIDPFRYCDPSDIAVDKKNFHSNLNYDNMMNLYLLTLKAKKSLNKKLNLEFMYLMASPEVTLKPMDYMQVTVGIRL